jgi:hypothetical protein
MTQQHFHERPALRAILVGGAFDDNLGRPSGYFRKFSAALSAAASSARISIINGGSFSGLRSALESLTDATHLFWFADVPNDYPKLLPVIKTKFPDLVLVQSKNNLEPRRYTRAQLQDRMGASGASYLLEFNSGANGAILATLLDRSGCALFEREQDIAVVARGVASHVFPNGSAYA